MVFNWREKKKDDSRDKNMNKNKWKIIQYALLFLKYLHHLSFILNNTH